MAEVLVLEPSPEAAERLRVVLEFASHQVEVVATPDDALNRMDSGDFEAIVLPTELGRKCGFELCRSVRALDLARRPAVLLLGRRADPMDVFRGLAAGADDFLLLPYDPDDLLERLAACLRRAENDPSSAPPVRVQVQGLELSVHQPRETALAYLASSLSDLLDAARAETRRRDRRNGLADAVRYVQPTLDALDAEFVLVDRDLRIVVANQAWRDALEVADPDIPHSGVGLRFTDVCRRAFGVGDDWCRIVRGAIEHALAEGASNFQLEYRRAADHARGDHHFRIAVRPMAGEARAHVAVTHQAVRAALTESGTALGAPDATQLPRTTEVVGLLAGGVVHRYGELLTSMRGYAQLAQRGLSANSRTARHLDQLLETIVEAELVTEKLLRLGRRPDTAVLVDVNVTLRSALDRLRTQFGGAVRLTASLHGTLRARFATKDQAERLLRELVGRAADHVGDGGSVRVETELVERLPRSRRHSFGSVTSPAVRLRVVDDGPPLPDDTIASLLDPLQATACAETELGMATVCGIVSQNRGRIDVQSDSRSGTTIDVYLPAGEDCAASIDDEPADTPLILVVEDEARVRELIESALTMEGYEVHAAEDGAAALEFVDETRRPIALLVTDIVMPGLDGRELAADLRLRMPALPCVFVSGYIPELSSSDGARHAADQFLSKPFALDDLIDAVRRALESTELDAVEARA